MASQILRRTLGSRYLANARAFSSASTPIRATLFPGDGIGPEIAESVKQVPFQFFISLGFFQIVRYAFWSASCV